MRTFKAASSTNNVHSVAIICDRVNARERTHLKPVRGRILRKYGVASLSHPMMMHFCDNSIRSRCDAEDVDANPSREITGCGPKSCVLNGWLLPVPKLTVPLSVRKLVKTPPLTSLQFVPSLFLSRQHPPSGFLIKLANEIVLKVRPKQILELVQRFIVIEGRD